MANVTDPLVSQLYGTDPQNLMEYITRQKIYDSRYWKEECFGLSVVNVLEKSVESLQCIGGLPCHFLSLILKLLQLHPEHEIVQKAFIEQETFKYTRALGCLYIRLTSRPMEIYNSLEPLLSDRRKLRVWTGTNHNRWDITTMDQFVYDLLEHTTSNSSSASISYLGITIPRLPSRHILQDSGYIPDGPRISMIHDTLSKYMNDKDLEENLTTESYAMAALQYLQYKATIQHCPAAIKAYEKRQKQQQSTSIDANGTITLTAAPTTTDNTSSSQSVSEKSRREDTSSSKSTKKRNYGTLFKSSKNNNDKSSMTTQQNLLSSSSSALSVPIGTINTHDNSQSDEYWNAERTKLGLNKLK